MAVPVTVSVNGPLFSSIYYELSNCLGDQEGFLLGEINTHVTDVINDAEIAKAKEEIVISLTSALPCESIHCFYGNSGEVLENNLHALIGSKLKEVVGWYRFRRSTSNEPMILEQRLHRRLSRWCCRHTTTEQQALLQQLFLFGVFTSSTSSNLATHSFDHSFFRFTGRALEGLSCKVINLGDTSQSGYKHESHLVLPVYRDVVDRLVQQSNTVPGGANSALAQIARIHDSLDNNLQMLYTQVTKDEALVRKLKRDVELMRNQLRIRESAAASPATPSTPDTDGLWLNVQSPLSSSSSSGVSRSSSTLTNAASFHQPNAVTRCLAVGKRQSHSLPQDSRGNKSNNIVTRQQTPGYAKNSSSLIVSPCISTTSTDSSSVGAAVQGSVFAMLPAISQSTAPLKKQNVGTGQELVFGRATSIIDSQSSKATKQFVPQITNQTGYISSEVPERTPRRNTNPFRVSQQQLVNDDLRDVGDGRHPIGKR